MTRPRLPLLVLAVAVPIAISIAAMSVGVALLPAHDLAVHWDAAGVADRYAPAWAVIALMAGTAVLGPLIFGLLLLLARGEGPTLVHRILTAASLWVATYGAAFGLWSILTQQDPHAGPPPVWAGLAIAFGAAVVVVVAGWLLAPPVVPVPPAGRTAEPLPLAPGERAAWVGRARFATGGIVAVCIGILVALAGAVLVLALTGGAAWFLLFIPAVMVVVLAMTASWTVRVDERGLTVRSATGWPRFEVPAADVASAGTTTVTPLGEFGGWGIRLGRGRRLGVIMRSGEALEVARRDGRALVVTVDDADRAAALLSAIAGQREGA